MEGKERNRLTIRHPRWCDAARESRMANGTKIRRQPLSKREVKPAEHLTLKGIFTGHIERRYRKGYRFLGADNGWTQRCLSLRLLLRALAARLLAPISLTDLPGTPGTELARATMSQAFPS